MSCFTDSSDSFVTFQFFELSPTSALLGRSVASVCLYVRALTGKRLGLLIQNMVHVYSISVARRALTQRSKGQRSRSHGYKNRHGRTVESDACSYSRVLLLLAWVCMSIRLPMFSRYYCVGTYNCNYKNKNKLQFLFVVKAAVLKQQILKFYPLINRTEATRLNQGPVINVKAS